MSTIKPTDTGLGNSDRCGAPEERGRVKTHFQSGGGGEGCQLQAVRGAYRVRAGKEQLAALCEAC